MTKKPLRVLVIEDSEFDGQMMISLLRRHGYDVTFERVETAEGLKAALADRPWDVILADYNLPQFDAAAALQIVQASGLDLPFIIVSGGIGEDIAVAAMKAGAHDYLMKGNLSRLAPAVERELREASIRTSQRASERALQESELRYRLLWETCPDAVILADPDTHIDFANPAARTVFGYAPEELVGQETALLQPERLRHEPEASLARCFRGDDARLMGRPFESIGRHKSGAEFPIEINFSHLEINGERRYVGFIRDITERKQAENELREHQEQFQVARDIQQRLFPKAAPALPGYDIGGASHPATAAGGDYFDYLPMLAGHVGLIVGDVTGHGVGPALLMAETRAYLRVLAGRREDVGEILTRANGILAEDIGSERFVTLFFASLNPESRSLVYASAGHPAGYILNASGRIKQGLPRTSVPLGIRPDTQYQTSAAVRLEPGDLVLLVSDGIEEAVAPDDTFFGTERTLEVVRAHQQRPASEIVDALYHAVRQFAQCDEQADDVTAIVLKVL